MHIQTQHFLAVRSQDRQHLATGMISISMLAPHNLSIMPPPASSQIEIWFLSSTWHTSHHRRVTIVSKLCSMRTCQAQSDTSTFSRRMLVPQPLSVPKVCRCSVSSHVSSCNVLNCSFIEWSKCHICSRHVWLNSGGVWCDEHTHFDVDVQYKHQYVRKFWLKNINDRMLDNNSPL